MLFQGPCLHPHRCPQGQVHCPCCRSCLLSVSPHTHPRDCTLPREPVPAVSFTVLYPAPSTQHSGSVQGSVEEGGRQQGGAWDRPVGSAFRRQPGQHGHSPSHGTAAAGHSCPLFWDRLPGPGQARPSPQAYVSPFSSCPCLLRQKQAHPYQTHCCLHHHSGRPKGWALLSSSLWVRTEAPVTARFAQFPAEGGPGPWPFP